MRGGQAHAIRRGDQQKVGALWKSRRSGQQIWLRDFNAVIYSWALGGGLPQVPHTDMHVACPQVGEVHPSCCQANGADTDRHPPPVCPAMTVLSKNIHLGLRFIQQPFEGWLAQRVLPGLASATLRRGHGAADLRTALVRAAILSAWFEACLIAKPQFPHLSNGLTASTF